MTRIPPALSYLTIYNPTLQPLDTAADDDEDVEAQTHILFYTSKEKAVSRDRILRQVGLAKALMHFAELFNVQDPCDTVRSQARRMIMVSPEPDFWIHAGIEVAKSVQVPSEKGKGKVKDKGKLPGQGHGPVYEFHDESVQDRAIRSLLLRGYEQFKLSHGSFSQIISTVGREVLELELERFFTVWAWSLNLEEIPDFGDHLGIPVHPTYRKIAKLLDRFEDGHYISIFAQPPHIVPSTNYFTHGYPLSLLRHILTLVPRPHLGSDPASHNLDTSGSENDAIPLEEASNDASRQQGTSPNNEESKKWYWPPYLTFSGKVPPKPSHDTEGPAEASTNGNDEIKTDEPQLSEVDTNALEDAMSTVTISAPLHELFTIPAQSVSGSTIKAKSDDQTEIPQSEEADTLFLSKSDPELQTSFVHLSEPAKPLLTVRRTLYYFIDNQRLLVVVPPGEDEPTVGTGLSMRAAAFFGELEGIYEDDVAISSTEQLPSAAKILQPSDRHTVAKEGLTFSNSPFSSRSHRLYEIQGVLDRDPDINEAFCRGQNPQHWHVGKRGLNVGSDKSTSEHGEVYLEVFRKESSLADVDNVLGGIVRKSDILDY